mgnify:CR=1 FL=1
MPLRVWPCQGGRCQTLSISVQPRRASLRRSLIQRIAGSIVSFRIVGWTEIRNQACPAAPSPSMLEPRRSTPRNSRQGRSWRYCWLRRRSEPRPAPSSQAGLARGQRARLCPSIAVLPSSWYGSEMPYSSRQRGPSRSRESHELDDHRSQNSSHLRHHQTADSSCCQLKPSCCWTSGLNWNWKRKSDRFDSVNCFGSECCFVPRPIRPEREWRRPKSIGCDSYLQILHHSKRGEWQAKYTSRIPMKIILRINS